MSVEEKIEYLVNKVDLLVEKTQQIDKRLDGIDNRLDGIDNRLDGIDNRLDGMDTALGQAKIRDEELLAHMKFGLEAREGLREAMEARFDRVEKKLDDEVGLLQDVFRDRRPH